MLDELWITRKIIKRVCFWFFLKDSNEVSGTRVVCWTVFIAYLPLKHWPEFLFVILSHDQFVSMCTFIGDNIRLIKRKHCRIDACLFSSSHISNIVMWWHHPSVHFGPRKLHLSCTIPTFLFFPGCGITSKLRDAIVSIIRLSTTEWKVQSRVKDRRLLLEACLRMWNVEKAGRKGDGSLVSAGAWRSPTRTSPSRRCGGSASRLAACLKTPCFQRRTSLCFTRATASAGSPGKGPRWVEALEIQPYRAFHSALLWDVCRFVSLLFSLFCFLHGSSSRACSCSGFCPVKRGFFSSHCSELGGLALGFCLYSNRTVLNCIIVLFRAKHTCHWSPAG